MNKREPQNIERDRTRSGPRSETVSYGLLLVVLALTIVWFVGSTLPYLP